MATTVKRATTPTHHNHDGFWAPPRPDFRGPATLVVVDHRVVRVPMAHLSAVVPDLLTLDQLGAASGLRGYVVRGFFRVLRAWPVSAQAQASGA